MQPYRQGICLMQEGCGGVMTASKIHNRLVIYPGDQVFAEGDDANWAFLIQSGQIAIIKKRPDGSDHTLAILGPGRLFGEMALIDDQPRMASARAVTETTLILIDNKVLGDCMEKAHPLLKELVRNLSANLRTTTLRHLIRVQAQSEQRAGQTQSSEQKVSAPSR